MKMGWEVKTLGKVCEIVNGGTPKTIVPEYWNGKHLWITPAEMGKRLNPFVGETERRITDLGLKDSSAQLLPANSIILSSRAPIGHLVINTAPMATNQGCKGLVPNNNLYFKYLYYYLGSIVDLLNALGTGATFKEISGGKLREVTIPLPSFPEQKRLVKILDEVFEKITKAKENAEKNLKNARELFESYLQNVFANPGKGWVEKKLEDAVDVTCTLSYGIVQPGNDYPNGLPIVRPTNLTTKVIQLSSLKRIDPKLAAGYRRTNLHGGELLLCVRGSTGVVAVASSELVGANVTRGIVPIRFAEHLVVHEFGYYLMTSTEVQYQIREKTYGAALMQINIGDLRTVTLSFPPLKQQKVIAAKLDSLSAETKKLEAIYKQKIADWEELKKSVLQKAFNGELAEA